MASPLQESRQETLSVFLQPYDRKYIEAKAIPGLIASALHPALHISSHEVTKDTERVQQEIQERKISTEIKERNALLIALRTGALPTTGDTPLSVAEVTESNLDDFIVSLKALSNYLSNRHILLKLLPTERNVGEPAYNNANPVDWAKVADFTVMPAYRAILWMSGLNPDQHIILNVEATRVRSDEEARAFFVHVKHMCKVAEAENMTTATGFEWISWADGHEFPVHSKFRMLFHQAMKPQLPPRKDGNEKDVPKNRSKHKLQTRRDVLAPIIDGAISKAVDPENPASVFAAMVALASSPGRPPPLLEFIEEEGIKYQGNDGVKFFTQKMLTDRMRRKNRT